jgi:hypothetical protein
MTNEFRQQFENLSLSLVQDVSAACPAESGDIVVCVANTEPCRSISSAMSVRVNVTEVSTGRVLQVFRGAWYGYGADLLRLFQVHQGDVRQIDLYVVRVNGVAQSFKTDIVYGNETET